MNASIRTRTLGCCALLVTFGGAPGAEAQSTPVDAVPVEAVSSESVPVEAVPVDDTARESDHPDSGLRPGLEQPDDVTTLPRTTAVKTSHVDLVFHSPSCFLSGSTHMGLLWRLNDDKADENTHTAGALTFGVLERDGIFLLPEPFADWTSTTKLLESGRPLVATEIARDILVIRNHREAVFQRPAISGSPTKSAAQMANGYTRRIVAAERKKRPQERFTSTTSRLIRLTATATAPAIDGKAAADDQLSMLVLVPQTHDFDVTALNRDPLVWSQLPSYEVNIESPDDKTTLVAMGLRHGSPARLKAELDLARATAGDDALLLHPGGGPVEELEGLSELCGETLNELGYDVVGVRNRDLLLSPTALRKWATTYKLPLIATNIRERKTKKSPFPRFRLAQKDGLDVLILSVIGDDDFKRLPALSQQPWQVIPMATAVADARDLARKQLGHPPDLVVLLASAEHKSRKHAENLFGVDIVIGNFQRWNDHTSRDSVVVLKPNHGGREGQALTVPSLVVHSGPYNVGSVRAHFGDRPPSADDDNDDVIVPRAQRLKLLSINHVDRPAVHVGPRDDAFGRSRERFLRDFLATGETTLLPDLAKFLDDDVKSLIYGDRVLSHGAWVKRPPTPAPQFSDPLWMRLVTNILREELRADAALAVNLHRGDDVSGALPRAILLSWLPSHPTVERIAMKGSDVIALAQAIGRHNAADAASRDLIFSAGIDLATTRIGGRPIDAKGRYVLAVSNELRRIPAVGTILSRGSAEKHLAVVDGSVEPAEKTKLPVRDVVLLALNRNTDGSGTFKKAEHEVVKRWLHDDVDTLRGRFRASIDNLSLSASAYRNTPNVSLFTGSGETRVTTPDLFQLGLDGRLHAEYDGPWVAAEAGFRGQLTSIFLDIPDANLPPQEQRDDVLAWTEGRLNVFRLSLLGDSFRLVPFVRVAVDSEFTATPKNPNDAAAGFNPHQVLLQQSAGAAVYVAPWLKELRAGLLVQQDLSALTTGDTAIYWDAGVQLSYRLTWPIWKFVFDSQLDLRYLVPDLDDRDTDLSLRVQAINKIVLPVDDWLNVFAFADIFVVNGKLSSRRDFGGSAVVGAGISLNAFVMWHSQTRDGP